MKDTYKITNVHPPTDEKEVVNKEYCDNNLLSSSNKVDILSRKITDLRRVDFNKVTTKTLKLKSQIVLNFVIKLLLILSLNIIN